VLIVAYAAICASGFILISGYRFFSLHHFIKISSYTLPGILIGTLLFVWLSPLLLVKILAVFLIFYSIYSLWKPNFKMPPLISRCLLFITGVIQGIFGTGAPFMLMAYSHEFKNKSELRTMVAAFLLFGNVLRFVQMWVIGELNSSSFIGYWWVIGPIALAITLGFLLHVKLKDKLFKQGVFFLMLIAGIAFLIK